LVRAQLVTLIGIPLAACTLVTDVVLLIWHYAGGIPPLRRELPGHLLAALLSIAVLSIALRAWHRLRSAASSSISPRVTRLIPVLLAVGIAGGLFVGNAWGHDAVDLERQVLAAMCSELLPAGPHGDPAPAALASCIDVALVCRDAGAVSDGASPLQPPGDQPSRNDWSTCIKNRLASAR
jgi:hypothetical protein